MQNSWIQDPIFWLIALPALVATGLLIQMILSLFSCCGTFKIKGEPVHLKWWMIPAMSGLCFVLWTLAVVTVLVR